MFANDLIKSCPKLTAFCVYSQVDCMLCLFTSWLHFVFIHKLTAFCVYSSHQVYYVTILLHNNFTSTMYCPYNCVLYKNNVSVISKFRVYCTKADNSTFLAKAFSDIPKSHELGIFYFANLMKLKIKKKLQQRVCTWQLVARLLLWFYFFYLVGHYSCTLYSAKQLLFCKLMTYW